MKLNDATRVLFSPWHRNNQYGVPQYGNLTNMTKILNMELQEF